WTASLRTRSPWGLRVWQCRCVDRSTTVGAVALAVLALGGHASRAGQAPEAAIERALRVGQYEAALTLASKRQARPARPEPKPAVLAARALVALGRYGEARRALEGALAATPDDLPARDALMRLEALVGNRAALEPLLARSYADWNGGRVDKTRAADLLAIAT